ncbi:MAG: PAS domain S-box protein, partial [Deltaproteobacteria bacterium]|nr:PAS domain S-box protein [Deltaproteobacteria bacterium]
VKTQKPDLVLMDIKLAGAMDGIETAEKIRAIADIPLVYLTAYTDDKRLAKARLTEPYGYIVKPAQNRELHATIEMALYKHALDRKLKESEEKYRLLADNATDIIWILDLATRKFIYFSPSVEKIRGFTPEEALEIPLEKMFTLDSYARVMSEFKETLELDKQHLVEHGRIRVFEFQEFCKDGSIISTEPRMKFIRDADGSPIRLQGITRDITERKRAENTIALTARKLTLMNDVTYQYIQNKVTAVRGYAELSKDVKTKAERLSFIEKEEHILADIHQLIKNTREYQEIGLLQPRWIPVEQSIRIAVSLVSPKQNIPIETALHRLELYSDPLIEKIFANLIENAVRHGKTLTRIIFSCEETPDGLILICEDNGVGISPEIKVHLFDRSVGENIHFGLFFIRECLLLSGMTIAETGEPGKGARFEITVPKEAYRFTGAERKN